MPSNNQPSMVSGHAQYAKGYVEETIGNVTGSKEWQESGKKDTEAGIGEMKVFSPFSVFLFPLPFSSRRILSVEKTRANENQNRVQAKTKPASQQPVVSAVKSRN